MVKIAGAGAVTMLAQKYTNFQETLGSDHRPGSLL